MFVAWASRQERPASARRNFATRSCIDSRKLQSRTGAVRPFSVSGQLCGAGDIHPEAQHLRAELIGVLGDRPIQPP